MLNRSAAFAIGVVYKLHEFRGVGDYSWLNIKGQPAECNDKRAVVQFGRNLGERQNLAMRISMRAFRMARLAPGQTLHFRRAKTEIELQTRGARDCLIGAELAGNILVNCRRKLGLNMEVYLLPKQRRFSTPRFGPLN
jgi:hypothetical protein